MRTSTSKCSLPRDLKKHHGDIKDHKAIVSIYLRTQRIKQAYDWIVGHIPNAEAEPYYLVSVYCWDKANRDPSLTPEDRSQFVELGLTSVDKALKMQPEYFDAMVYYNLLYREKAKLQTDEKLKQEYFDKADEWRNKALALREKLKKQTSFAKSNREPCSRIALSHPEAGAKQAHATCLPIALGIVVALGGT
jgi:hypothetical protein